MKKLHTDWTKVQFNSYGKARYQSMNWSWWVMYMYYKDWVIKIPKYQRWFVWKDQQQIALIESILKEIPIPPLIIKQTDWVHNRDITVVDWQQRLTTVMNFLDWAEVNRPKMYARIKNTTIPTIRIDIDTDDWKFDDEYYYNLFNYWWTPHEW